MNCPKCSKPTGGIALVVGFVKIVTGTCSHCRKPFRVKSLLVPFQLQAFAEELERLQGKYPGPKPLHVRIAITYLQAKIDAHNASALEKEASTRKKRNDLWERQFLKAAMGEDA